MLAVRKLVKDPIRGTARPGLLRGWLVTLLASWFVLCRYMVDIVPKQYFTMYHALTVIQKLLWLFGKGPLC